MSGSHFSPPALGGAAALLIMLASGGTALAYTEKTIFKFCEQGGFCPHGSSPQAAVIVDGNGNLWGTTKIGGKYGHGLAFEITEAGGKTYYHIIKNFCAKPNCADGATPVAPLIMGNGRELFGTTYAGGKYGGGVLFRLTPVSGGWHYAVLHNFGNGSAGKSPAAGLTYKDQQSGALWSEDTEPVFGTTAAGGTYGNGTTFEFVRSGSSWTYTTIHSFQSSQAPNELAMDASGNLFGTTGTGGKYGGGLLYELASGSWNETVFHNFCGENGCGDGSYPLGRMWVDANGNLYGTTQWGGHTNCSYLVGYSGCGTVFEYSPGSHTYTALYKFPSISNGGFEPAAGVIMDSSGNLFGTTLNYFGETAAQGVVFELSPGGNGNWTYAQLFEGNDSWSPIAIDSGGNLFGTSYSDPGGHGGGSVFGLYP
ncbi:MAG TPA: choice-of-anchor tandem repeat GloVer-containing protein [Rhizomicrobium sp.]|jgi:uncharacterized repeat protein (TIGR03803 family)